jgi:hypothetical protein
LVERGAGDFTCPAVDAFVSGTSRAIGEGLLFGVDEASRKKSRKVIAVDDVDARSH